MRNPDRPLFALTEGVGIVPAIFCQAPAWEFVMVTLTSTPVATLLAVRVVAPSDHAVLNEELQSRVWEKTLVERIHYKAMRKQGKIFGLMQNIGFSWHKISLTLHIGYT